MATEAVKVATRVRPLNKKEREEGKHEILRCDGNSISIMVPEGMEKERSAPMSHEADDDKRTFTFDFVYGINTKQIDIFEQTVKPIVDSAIEGYNGEHQH